MVLLASEFDLSRFLNAEGYGERDKKFRIKAVAAEVFEQDGKAENKLALWFTNSNQGLPLNKTNLRTLKAAFGDDTANWVGKVIVVFRMMTNFRGKLTPGLRVRIPPPKQTTAAIAPQQPATSGNGAAALPVTATPVAGAASLAAAAPAVVDPELEPDPVKPIGEDLDDEVAF